ncbi:hypothetical protein ARMGADRAFT_1092278 [Armillaria gallica]|uniref:Uncharacterized protein n=1 Tax=Armillaria gallica TaxID=47427 RepID=A0A2H3CEW7_ARMGA|nr:hypothetical protein ARMGADRAFT_1092278 [Armillaria gallica]
MCSASVLSDALPQADEDDDKYDPDTWDRILDDIVDSRAGVIASEYGNTAQPAPTSMPEIWNWSTLCKQIKKDLKKNLQQTKYNQLLILRNFATLRIKGFKRIEASLNIARQWHEGEGCHFAHRVCTLAQHYQLFEQLPEET